MLSFPFPLELRAQQQLQSQLSFNQNILALAKTQPF